MTHKAAKDSFNRHKGKLPSVKELSDEYGKVLAKKKAAYSEYKEVRKNMQTYQTAKYDIDKILGIEKTPDQNRTREQTRCFFRDITIRKMMVVSLLFLCL